MLAIEHELPPLAGAATRVLIASEFVMGVLERQARALLDRIAEAEPLASESVEARIEILGLTEAEAMASLRRFRNVEMARIAWRDIAGEAELEASLNDLSELAIGLLRNAVEFAMRALERRFGRPERRGGEPAPLLTLAMGKLGGGELNFSSDIDLVFLYPDDAVLGGHTGAELQPYYTRVAQLVIKLLDQATPDGFAYRIDTRLRPFGASGPLVLGLSAFETYLVSNGRDWERYAYQKARLVSGRAYKKEVFDEILTPFVYRGYVDYGVFESLRQMKALIRQQVAQRDMADNIKLGSGGIREVEFIVQAFQLVRGGRDASLRQQSLLPVLPRLGEERQLEEPEVAALRSAYRFLRRVENRLQALDDRQTHELPSDPETRARLCVAMDTAEWAGLTRDLGGHRAVVEQAFDKVVYLAAGETPASVEPDLFQSIWEMGLLDPDPSAQLPQFDAESVRLLVELRTGALYQRMDEVSRTRLAAVMVRTLRLLAEDKGRAVLVERVLPIYQSICRRSAYLALLDQNPAALERLLVIARRSGNLSRLLAAQPILLDELLDPRIFDTPPTRIEFRELLRSQLARAKDKDLEASLDALRQFQGAAIFRIAVADTLGQLPLMHVSDRLTDTAELVVQFALDLARAELSAKHGRPMCGEGGERREAGFAIIAYGKLAGLELGYGSDLDLVFVHDSRGAAQCTDGRATLDNAVFFARLAQRVIHYLSIQTVAGRLYEVDTRLRPSGRSGQLVVSMDNFRKYQFEEAWVWEHQALLRSRAIAGSKVVCDEFERQRREILVSAVDRENLKSEVVNMRARMRKELSKSGASEFDIKQDRGGLADIEFLVDYLVLANLPQFPDLAEFPDNIRQLEALERAGILAAETAARLKDVYLSLRERTHDLALDNAGRAIDAAEFGEQRQFVSATWDSIFG